MFKPDLFSISSPIWCRIKEEKKQFFFPILKSIFYKLNLDEIEIEYSGSLEINSSNIKIVHGNKKILLKKWDINANEVEIKKIISLQLNLWKNLGLTAKPEKFLNNSYIHKNTDNIFTISEFVEGDYFSGSISELKNSAISIAKLTNTLQELPKNLYPSNGPEFNFRETNSVIKEIRKLKNEWQYIFGKEDAQLLRNNWDYIESVLDLTKDLDLGFDDKQPIHFDLHPHNILCRNKKICAFLDYDAIKNLNVSSALSFASLKLCRQTVSVNPLEDIHTIKNTFLNELQNNLNVKKDLFDNIYFYSIAEVLRRITIIFKLNLMNNKKWNRVLEMQLNHLKEAEMLFG